MPERPHAVTLVVSPTLAEPIRLLQAWVDGRQWGAVTVVFQDGVPVMGRMEVTRKWEAEGSLGVGQVTVTFSGGG